MTRNAGWGSGSDAHEQARELIALGRMGLVRAKEMSHAQQGWLQAHLAECAECRDYAEAAERVVSALRSVPLAADLRLVRTTQMRVRFHAARLREARERIWVVGMACLGVGLSATLTLPLLWKLFAWMGEWVGVSKWVWEAGFTFSWIAPAVVVSVLLWARGSHWGRVYSTGSDSQDIQSYDKEN
jgi:predicted anti-sigma-YlaC factor YlaD